MKPICCKTSNVVFTQGVPVAFGEDDRDKFFLENLRSQIDTFSPLPPSVIYFGVAKNDGKPVLLDLLKPSLGSILIRGDLSTGKTALMQAVASGAAHVYAPQDLQFLVITPKYLEWTNWAELPCCGGIYSSQKVPFEKMIHALDLWLKRPDCSQALLFFVDGLSTFQNLSPEAVVKLQRLLTIGPYRNIWPIVTATEDEFYNSAEWRKYFKAQILSGAKKDISFFHRDFAVKEGSSWCIFSVLK